MAGLAHEIGNHPVLFPLLDGLECQCERLAPQSTAQQQGHHRVVAQSAQGGWAFRLEEAPALFRRQPVPQAHPEAPHALHAANARGELGTEETSIGRLIGHAPDGGQSEVDRGRRVVTLLEMDAIAQHTVRLNASRGSEQYQATNSVMAWS